ncbi:DUF2157 domain-containing protein [Cupriavidus consociatus]|uniref:DUF2157 domain-containing protein n=1 Tax=Cupriavidus consociatus TaxID=2821357 RepID=UPI001AEA1ED5|nr:MULTISPECIES: DUF2157 domain-containing protein [unclassified Cupriavidus]MBP0622517.1 DUF2157 domain-containing protein [Cupriavidus sp. LEh25]MDK2659202.1 DUF2157 domain-containing protein [Cupriavidus sp. LEh21]
MQVTSTVANGERRAIRRALADWRACGRLAAAAIAAPWARTEPAAADWRRWLDQALMALGTALLCAGVIVFFAFNWQDLHKFSKFGLLAAAITVLAAFAWLRPAADAAGRAALGGAQVLAGVLLAVIGQTYQTGADAWQLFALWALLAVPWALAARAAPHWWLVLVVGNVALLRYFSIRFGMAGLFALLFDSRYLRTATLALLGAVMLQLALWHLLAARAPGLGFRGQTGSRLLAALACVQAGSLGLTSLFDSRFDAASFALAVAVLAGLAWWYRQRAFDIVVLSLTCLTGIVLVVAGLGKLLFEGKGDFGAFLLLGLVTIGLAAGAAAWLMRAYRAQLRVQLEQP